MTAVRVRIVRCTCPPTERICECEGDAYGTTPVTIEVDSFEDAVELLLARLPSGQE